MLPHALAQKEEAKKRQAEQDLEALEAKSLQKKRKANENGYAGFLKE
jgi:hypothetical protein